MFIANNMQELMAKYEWNNMLHHNIEKILVLALESDSHVLKRKVKFNLTNLLIYQAIEPS